MGLLGGSKIKSTIKSSKAFIDQVTDPMFIVDKDLLIHYINDQALKAMGYSREEVIGKMTCGDLCQTPLCKTDGCTIINCMDKKQSIIGQTVAQTKDGTKVPVRAACNALYDEKGKPIGGFEIIGDVRQLDEGFLNNMADAAFRTDTNLVIQNINDTALKAMGYTREEVVGKMTCADLCKTPLCNTDNCTIKNCMERKTTIVGTTVAETKNGTKIPVRASCGVLLDDKGNPTGGFEIISDITQVDEGFLSNLADAAFRTDTNLVIQNINNAALNALGYSREEVVGKMTCADLCKTPVCGTESCTIKKCMAIKSTVVAETDAMTKDGRKIPVRASCGPLLDASGNVTGGFEVITDNTDLMSMIGDLKSVADGDLTIQINENAINRDDAVGKMANAVSSMVDQLTDIISNIIASAQNLAQAVEQISSGNQNLSQRTSEQASSLEEIASTIEEATATIKQNADNAQQANESSTETYSLAEEGGSVVVDAVGAMEEITDSSKKIGEIISVINEIAFQTNLLALNAAVEAARAGEQGRGFAVVAGEVRNLAQRASSAAKEIEDLIKDSLGKIEKGSDLSNKSGESLKKIIGSVKSVGQIVSEIAAASQEQKQGIDQINTAITEMDTMTQQNASLVEETASASEEMANQAQELLGMMERFKISGDSQLQSFNQQFKVRMEDAADAGKKRADGGNGNGRGEKGAGEPKFTAKPVPKQSGDISNMLSEEGFEEF